MSSKIPWSLKLNPLYWMLKPSVGVGAQLVDYATAKIFLSYRRTDSKDIAGRLSDQLQSAFRKQNIFFDLESLPYGSDFGDHIKAHVRQSTALIAVIGENWQSGIFKPDDWVKTEIATALESRVKIIPVLTGNVQMPRPTDLPESIRAICKLQAAPLSSGRDFKVHAERIIAAITES